ncbi:hypothetical protein AOCH_005539 [Aspergillus ochraceoroseus]|uniref:RRM domain-containing protein n=1 Tax=Aspergillus ochraceoroseus TaxID=138278 RepID=A0A0F8X441_9EURO|nr:hypothetical protein AOCH_005539 [Aspergillus ochraceoroseus]
MSSNDIPIPYGDNEPTNRLLPQTPAVAKSLLSVALNYINVAGKEREAATTLLARLSLRRDMQNLGVLTILTEWSFAVIHPMPGTEPSPVYAYIGVLSFLARLGASGQAEDFAPLIIPVFKQTMRLMQDETEISQVILSSALARKTIIKILRSVTVLALSLGERNSNILSDDHVSYILEEAIDHLLTALADKDTPVRFAASKALSIITLKLDPDMATEVIEAVTGSLEENILYNKQDGTIITPSAARKIGIHTLKRNLSAVDAQKWQGLILTLGHLLFRRAPPTHKLPKVLQPLVSGLDFEQRSSTGSSVGTGVRDASCFGIWALSRKYTTQELLAIKRQDISSSISPGDGSTLQMLAIELVCAACVDPSGNIRRGASAALQELIGRHPNTVVEGISLVQAVDYHAVARRSRAMIEVAKATADLSSCYWGSLIESLIQWRGIASPDAESRRHAAKALGVLSTQDSYKSVQLVLRKLFDKLHSIPHGDVETRHGCFLAVSAVIDAFNAFKASEISRNSSDAVGVAQQIAEFWQIFDSHVGPTKDDLTLLASRPELTAEAFSCFVSSLSQSLSRLNELRAPPPSTTLLDKCCDNLQVCLSRSDDISIESASKAISAIWPLLASQKQDEIIQGWFSHIRATRNLPTGRGQLSALGSTFNQLDAESTVRETIIEELLWCAEKEGLIEKRVVAIKSFTVGVLPHIHVTDNIASSLIGFLNDYTTDRRGDIGSLIRLEGIQAARVITEKKIDATSQSNAEKIAGCLCRLAAEKLDKVRLEAWLCLQIFWSSVNYFPPLQKHYGHFSEVSSTDYFVQLLELQAVEWLRIPLFQGLATSAVAGAEGLIRSSRAALVQSINKYEAELRPQIVISIIQDLLLALSDKLIDDRYAIPILELLAFLLDGYVSSVPDITDPSLRKVFVLAQKVHFKSSNIARLEAAIRAYAPLSRLERLRIDVLKKLTGMLLHPFPRVRVTTADYLFMETGLGLVKTEDWTRPPKELKGKVEEVREVLACQEPPIHPRQVKHNPQLVADMATIPVPVQIPPNPTVYVCCTIVNPRAERLKSPPLVLVDHHPFDFHLLTPSYRIKLQVRNLEERIKVDQLKEALEEIFSEYGNVLEIVAKTNLKAKGQAFVVFDNVESATRAIDEINGFEIFDKPMVLDYAKTRSDVTVLREGGEDELEAQ